MMDYAENDKPATHLEYTMEVLNTPEAVRQRAFGFMDQLEGWCSHDKAAILIDLVLKVKPEKVVEIGVYGGKSVVPVACALKANGKGKIYGIDPWDKVASLEEVMNESNQAYWGWVDHEEILRGLVEKIEWFNLEKQIELIRATSEAAAPINDIDILHVDGNHSDKTSYYDVTKWAPLVRSGGWIIMDDMNWFENGVFTTARAVEWLNTHCTKIAEFQDTSLWGIWVKP